MVEQKIRSIMNVSTGISQAIDCNDDMTEVDNMRKRASRTTGGILVTKLLCQIETVGSTWEFIDREDSRRGALSD